MNTMVLTFDLFINFIENMVIIKTLELFFYNKRNSYFSYFFIFLLTIISTFINNYIYPPILCSFILLLLLVLYSLINLKGDIKNKLLISIIVYANLAIINLSFLIIAILLKVNLNNFLTQMNFTYFFIATFSKLIYVVQYFYIKKFTTKNFLLSKVTWGLLATLLISFALTIEIFFTNFILHQYKNVSLIIILILEFFVIILIVFNICIQMNKDNRRLLEQEIYLETHKYEEKLVKSIEDKINYINKFNHDLKNHMLVLERLSKENPTEAKEYKEDLLQPQSIIKTNNKVLNYILNDKINIANNLNIDVQCIIQGTFDDKISLVDLNIILSNLLDNAIEASSISQKKKINIKIYSDSYKIIINISNSFKNELIVSNPKLFTTKTDKNKHGYGLSNIQFICDKYNGENSIYQENDMFYHTCVLLKNLDFSSL